MVASNSPSGVSFLGLVQYAIIKRIHPDLFLELLS